MKQPKMIMVGLVTHLVTTADDTSARKVLEAIRSGGGSDKCPRTFSEWQSTPNGEQAMGKIADKPVTLLIGEPPTDAAVFRLQTNSSLTKRCMQVNEREAYLNQEISSTRQISLAEQLAASLFLHQCVGVAADPAVRAAARERRSANKAPDLLRHEYVGGHFGD